MKTIYETILSSTNSGKNRNIDVDYLLKHGFEPDTSHGNLKTLLKHKETGFVLRTYKDKILLDILKDDNVSIKTLVVSTIEDLDLVIELFKEWKKSDSRTEEAHLRKAISKKLKEL